MPAAGARQGLPNGIETTALGLGTVDLEDPDRSPGIPRRPFSYSAPGPSRDPSGRRSTMDSTSSTRSTRSTAPVLGAYEAR